jgi:CRISPR-associated protein Cmr1
MEKVTFEVETITPMFLAGNDQKKVKVPGRHQKFNSTPPSNTDDYSWQKVVELRASSIRGLMRYWQRAIVGSLATTNTERMRLIKQAEKEIFGTTEHGSAIQIRIERLNIHIHDFTEEISKLNPQSRQYEATDKGYLLFSLVEAGNKKANDTIEEINQEYRYNTRNKQEKRQGEEISAYQPPRQYIAEGSTFRVIFSVHSSVQDGKELLRKATAAFWLLANFGGLGSRSRRCAGSIRVTKVENNFTNLSFDAPQNTEQLQEQLKEGIEYIRRLWAEELLKIFSASRPTPVEVASFDILDTVSDPKSCHIWILPDNEMAWSSAEDAMKDIGGSLKAYRPTLNPEERAIFGLPIIVQRGRNQPYDKEFEDLLKSLKKARMASPLLLRVSWLQSNQYIGIAVLFKTKGKYVSDMDDYQFINDFIKEYYSDALEVTL